MATPGPTPLSQIIAQAIASAHKIADNINSATLSNYNQQKANVIQWNQTATTPQPLPATPYVIAVNDAAIAAGETANSLDLSNAFTLIKYVDPAPTPAPPPDPGTITLDLNNPIAPGCYRILTGNAHFLPLHSVLQYPPGSGHFYSLEDTPMTGLYYQQIA